MGITNIKLEKQIKNLNLTRFKGVFSVDELPVKLFASLKPMSVVCNLSKSSYPRGTHFVSIISDGKNLLYLDPAGKAPFQKYVFDLIKKCKLTLLYNKRRYQSQTSVYCGYYCAMFVVLYDPKWSWKWNARLKGFSRRQKKKENDKNVISNLNKMSEILAG